MRSGQSVTAIYQSKQEGVARIDKKDIRAARIALYQYPVLNRKRAEPKITPDYGGVVVQHGATRVTENVALAVPLTEQEERIVSAVDQALDTQAHNYNAADRLRVTQMVYFRRTHTLLGAAMEVGYNKETVRLWNRELLMSVYSHLKKD